VSEWWRGAGSADVTIHDFLDLFFGDGTDDLVSHLTALKNEQGGDAAESVFI